MSETPSTKDQINEGNNLVKRRKGSRSIIRGTTDTSYKIETNETGKYENKAEDGPTSYY